MNGTSRTSRFGPRAGWPTATLALVGAVAIGLAAGATSIRNPGDLAFLLALSLASCVAGAFALPAFRIDVGLVLAFVAMLLVGPLGAFAVVAVPELIRPRVQRTHVRPIAWVANVASFAWAALVCWGILLALPVADGALDARVAAYSLAATAMVLANFGVTRGIVAGMVDGVLLSGWRDEGRALAATLALVPFAVLAACLLPTLGILALAAAAAAEGLLTVLVGLATWTPRAGGLSVAEARARYAAALASRTALSRSERRVLLAAARTGTGRMSPWLSHAERDRVAKTLLLAGLWPGSGRTSDDCFARLQPAEVGIESRVLRVADGWAALTASGTEQLEHGVALLTLHNDPRRYDRAIVAVARGLIRESDCEAAAPRVPHARALSRRLAQLKTAA